MGETSFIRYNERSIYSEFQEEYILELIKVRITEISLYVFFPI